MHISDIGIVLELFGFSLLVPHLSILVWKLLVRNDPSYKSEKKNYGKYPFEILLKNIRAPLYQYYHNLKDKFWTAGIMFVILGLILQLSWFNNY